MAIPYGNGVKPFGIFDRASGTREAWHPAVDRIQYGIPTEQAAFRCAGPLAGPRQSIVVWVVTPATQSQSTTRRALLNVAVICVQLTGPGATLWAEKENQWARHQNDRASTGTACRFPDTRGARSNAWPRYWLPSVLKTIGKLA